MEPEGSLPHSQQHATYPYPGPDHVYALQTHVYESQFYYYLPIYACLFQVDSFPQIYPPKPCVHLSSPHTCYMPCLSVSVFLI